MTFITVLYAKKAFIKTTSKINVIVCNIPNIKKIIKKNQKKFILDTNQSYINTTVIEKYAKKYIVV
jgi:hypothetical protein